MKAEKLWEKYITEYGIENQNYDTFKFGLSDTQANELSDLVKKGIKTATSSAYILYELENEELPKEDTYSIVLDSNEEAVCIIKNSKVYITKFNEVSSEHAFKEGEGNRTLKYWKKVHKPFFEEELSIFGKKFDEEMLVVCEEFEVVYK